MAAKEMVVTRASDVIMSRVATVDMAVSSSNGRRSDEDALWGMP